MSFKPVLGGDGMYKDTKQSLTVLDARYLKLDCSNDPLTDTLEIGKTLTGANAGAGLYIDTTLSGTGSYAEGIELYCTVPVGNASDLSGTNLYGIYMEVADKGSGNLSSLVGYEAYVDWNSVGTCVQMHGALTQIQAHKGALTYVIGWQLNSSAVSTGADTLSCADIRGAYLNTAIGASGTSANTSGNLTGVYIKNDVFTLNTGTTTLDNVYGLRIVSPGITGTPAITNNYGIHIGSQAGVGATNNYSIYSEGGKNYFGGSMTILTDDNAYDTLTLQGIVGQSSNYLTAWKHSNGTTVGYIDISGKFRSAYRFEVFGSTQPFLYQTSSTAAFTLLRVNNGAGNQTYGFSYGGDTAGLWQQRHYHSCYRFGVFAYNGGDIMLDSVTGKGAYTAGDFNGYCNNFNLKLGDNAGASKLYIKDSDGVAVASIDSDGNILTIAHRAAGSGATIRTDSVDSLSETFTGYDLANYNSVGQFVNIYLNPSADLTENIFQTGGYYTAQWNSARDGMIATSPNGKYASIRGFNGTAGTAGTATGNLERAMGVYMITQHLGSGIINNAYGVWSWIDNNNTTNETGNINVATNYYSQCTTGKATGIIGSRYGMRIIDATGAGSLTNQYGLYIDSLAKGSGVNQAIYLAGTGANNGILMGTDTNIYRSAANTLKTDDTFNAGAGVIFPTSDPAVAGAWWDNAGTLTKSAG